MSNALFQALLMVNAGADGAACVPDTYWNNTVLLLHFDGVNDGIIFTDSSPKSKDIVVSGDIKTKATPAKFGQSLDIPSTGGWLGTSVGLEDFQFGTGDFTVEFWMNTTSPRSAFIVDYIEGGVPGSWAIILASSGSNVGFWNGAGAGTLVAGTANDPRGKGWVHIAFAREAGTLRVFYNGVIEDEIADTTDYNGGPAQFTIGQKPGYDITSNYDGYLDEFRVTKGVARYTAAFDPATLPYCNGNTGEGGCIPDEYYSCGPTNDPYWDNVVLMLHGDGVDGGTTFIDSSNYAKTISPVGNAQLSTNDPKFGTASIKLDGAGDYLEGSGADSDFDFTTEDFTVEAWIKPTDESRLTIIINNRPASPDRGFSFSRSSTNTLSFNVWDSSAGTFASMSGGVIVKDFWHHVAVTRQSSTFRLFVNGIQVATTTTSTSIGNSTAPITIGFDRAVAGRDWIGYIDDIRVTKGIARYTGNFNIPAAAFPNERASNKTASLIQTSGSTNVEVTTPTRFTHKVSALASASSFYYPARIKTNSLYGKRYVEFKIIGPGRTSLNDGRGYCVGLTLWNKFEGNPYVSSSVTFGAINYNYSGGSIGYVVNGSAGITDASYDFVQNDIVCLAYDETTGNLWYRVNNTAWIGGGDPEVGTSPTHILTRRPLVPYVTCYKPLSEVFEAEVEIIVDSTKFIYTPPIGFQSFDDVDWVDPPKTILSLHAEDTTDSSCYPPKTLTLLGDATVSTDQFKFQTSSFYIPNTGITAAHGLSIDDHMDFDFGTLDWTLEFWAYRNVNTYTGFLFIGFAGTRASIGTDGLLDVFWVNSDGAQSRPNLVSISTGVWHHYVFQRRGLALDTFVDGALVDTFYLSNPEIMFTSNGPIYFGRTTSDSAQTLNGYMDEIRLTRGVARYIDPFDPAILPNCDSIAGSGLPITGKEYPAGQEMTMGQGNIGLLDHYVRLTGQTLTASTGTTFAGNFSVPSAKSASYTVSTTVASSAATTVAVSGVFQMRYDGVMLWYNGAVFNEVQWLTPTGTDVGYDYEVFVSVTSNPSGLAISAALPLDTWFSGNADVGNIVVLSTTANITLGASDTSGSKQFGLRVRVRPRATSPLYTGSSDYYEFNLTLILAAFKTASKASTYPNLQNFSWNPGYVFTNAVIEELRFNPDGTIKDIAGRLLGRWIDSSALLPSIAGDFKLQVSSDSSPDNVRINSAVNAQLSANLSTTNRIKLWQLILGLPLSSFNLLGFTLRVVPTITNPRYGEAGYYSVITISFAIEIVGG